ncbi:hypothetical protein MATL_G00203250 [Megalops atlanticus]|uniref:A kinase-anchoring proteins AKAP-5 and AKAP-12 calmodulin (CaM)-binding domain-containing protein n=1 Tax=Megalops atlanticus TaxID=7932 RepID=A0A9D3PHW3_MEGAT|nr:hypothetical protein MATL_G00203250 [Megalops atlanticus]
MGASVSARQDVKTEEDATTEEQNAEVNEVQEEEDVDAKLLQKNGQISSLNGSADDQTGEFNGQTEETVLAEVGQTDATSVSQKEDGPETMEVLQEEVAPQVNGEKEEKESPSADEVTAAEEKADEEKATSANEVGFKKIFRFVGFKFTLKKDKTEKAEPVQLLTVKKEEEGEASGLEVAEESKEEVAAEEAEAVEEAEPVEEEKATEAQEITEPTAEAMTDDVPAEQVNGDTTEQVPEAAEATEATEEAIPEKEAEAPAQAPAIPVAQETQSPLRRFFTQGIFSNLRRRTSVKKPKEEEPPKEKAVEEDLKETDETAEAPAEDKESAALAEKPEEPKPSEEEQKIEVSTEEPKKKMDTSVSWEALICVGSAKKRARKTSDSDDEAPRIEEEAQQSGEEQAKPAESPLGSSQEADHEHLTSSPEQAGSPSEGEGVSTWESLKRFVTPRRKTKAEDKTEESTGVATTEQVSSDNEIPKEESSFSLKKLIPGRKKKKSEAKQDQVSSDEAGKDVGSVEEDSDTPAVVPLSEYDSVEPEQVEVTPKEEAVTETKAAETTEAEESKPEPEPEVVKPKDAAPVAAGDERSPSFISPAAVEDIQETTECITKHQQLSDIPEEGDTVATLKSTADDVSRDDTIAEDIVELASEMLSLKQSLFLCLHN